MEQFANDEERFADACREQFSGEFEESNGMAERAIQSVEGMMRTIRFSLEERWEVTVGIVHHPSGRGSLGTQDSCCRGSRSKDSK